MQRSEVATVHPLRHVVVIAFLALLLGLGVRTLLTEDTRLGWGMFSYQTNYAVRYEWVRADGTVRPQPALDLQGRTLKYLGDRTTHRTRYGLGAIRSWMRSYALHMYATHCTPDVVAFRAVVDYRINAPKLRLGMGKPQRLVVPFPEVVPEVEP